MMFGLFSLFAPFFLIAVLLGPILAIVALIRTSSLEQQLKEIRKLLAKEKPVSKPAKQPAPPTKTKPIPPPAPPPPKQPPVQKPKPRLSFEERFGARLPVWIGAIAFVLASVYLVRYSLEQEWLTPLVRVLMSSGFGVILLIGAQWLYDHPKQMASPRFPQALAGAGLAILFGAVYSATNIHGLLATPVGFVGLAIVAGFAVVLSLRFGPPIALIGLLGGFLTPALISAETPEPGILFTYLFVLYAALMAVVVRKSWWAIGVLAYIGALLWTCWWMIFLYAPIHRFWLAGFIAGITALSVLAFNRTNPKEIKFSPLIAYAPFGFALILLATLLQKGNFALIDWGLFSLIGLSCVILARVDEARYIKLPWLAMVGLTLMLLVWDLPPFVWYGVLTLGFATLFSASGYAFLWNSKHPKSWGHLSAVACVVFYLVLYHEWRLQPTIQDIHLFWGTLAFILASLQIIAVQRLLQTFDSKHPDQPKIVASYCIAATGLITIGLGIELAHKWYMLALSLEILALSWLNRYLPLQVFQTLMSILLGLFLLLLAPQLYSVLLHIFHQQDFFWPHFASIPIVKDPVGKLAVPLVAFSLAHIALRQQTRGQLLAAIEILQGLLITVLIYIMTQQLLSTVELLSQNGVLHSLWILLSLAGIWVGQKTKRPALTTYSQGLGWFSIAHLLIFDLGRFNPIWSEQNIGEHWLFNSLALAYALPGTLLILSLYIKDHPKLRQIWTLCGAALLFIFANLTLRSLFQGTTLNQPLPLMSNAELYSYSVLWIIIGLCLLGVGIVRQRKDFRYASLALMGISVGKVFLIDARELVGLWRVLSFFGLGLSLIFLGYVYQRFIGKESR